MTSQIDAIRTAILEGAPAEDIANLPIPESTRAAVILAEEQEMFAGMASEDKDPRQSVHIQDVALPEIAPDEAVIAVMATSINFNTVWTSIFEPVSTFGFLKRLGKESALGARHDQPFHVMGSDASGVVLRVGSAVRNWKPGDKITVHCNHVDDQDPSSHSDSMMGLPTSRACPLAGLMCISKPGPAFTSTTASDCVFGAWSMCSHTRSMPATSRPTTRAAMQHRRAISG